jgi:hypothetical protein
VGRLFVLMCASVLGVSQPKNCFNSRFFGQVSAPVSLPMYQLVGVTLCPIFTDHRSQSGTPGTSLSLKQASSQGGCSTSSVHRRNQFSVLLDPKQSDSSDLLRISKRHPAHVFGQNKEHSSPHARRLRPTALRAPPFLRVRAN